MENKFKYGDRVIVKPESGPSFAGVVGVMVLDDPHFASVTDMTGANWIVDLELVEANPV